jgi:rhodanese-related sulfurtransferase
MKLSVQQMMSTANAVIDTVSVHDALKYHDDPQVKFIDLRDDAEREQEGKIPGALHASRSFLEFYADPAMPMHNPVFSSGSKLILFCASGGRSTLAAKTLLDMGVANVNNMAGGFDAWREANGQIEGL